MAKHEVQDARLPVRTQSGLAIVGFADGHREQAPKDGDIWGLNRLFKVMDRPWTAWFDIHDLHGTYGDGRPGGRDEEWITFARGFTGPVYVREQDLPLAAEWGIKGAVAYPLRPVLEAFPRYFTNSISYMLALGILMRYERIGVYGVDMAQDALTQAEYSNQRPSCEFMLGAAVAAGIEVDLPDGTDLLRSSHLYGFEDDTGIQLRRRTRLTELEGRKNQLKQEMANLEQQVANIQGQKQQLFAGINQLDGAMQQVLYEMRQLSPEAKG